MAGSRRLLGTILFCVILLGGLTAQGCDTGPAGGGQGEGPGHRAQKLGLSPQQELELGRKAYQEVLSHPEEYGKALPKDSAVVQRVRGIAVRIVKAAQIEPLQREINLQVKGYGFEWDVNVLKNPQVNAFCLPGGKIAVFTGILPVAADDDQLATVMSHEISHALAHHASERLFRAQKMDQALDVVNGTMGGMDQPQRQNLLGLLAAGAGLRGKKYEREQETEADHIGLFLMTFAGYDPDEAVRFWERMEQVSGNNPHPPEIFSDHPSDAHRIEAMQHWIPLAKAAKKAYEEGRIAPAAPNR